MKELIITRKLSLEEIMAIDMAKIMARGFKGF